MEDKLPAIQGIANEIQSRLPYLNDYNRLAGMWFGTFANQLLWRVDSGCLGGYQTALLLGLGRP